MQNPEIKVGTGSKRNGTFILNPSINPKYGIEGFSPHQIDVGSTAPIASGEYDEIYTGSKINIKLSTNFDEDPLNPAEQYAFYLIQADTPAELRSRMNIDVNKDTDLYSNPAAQTLQSYIQKLSIPVADIKKSGSSYVATVTLEHLNIGSYYILQVCGSDQSDSPDHTMVPDPKDKSGGQYIFKLRTNGAKPEVSIAQINGKDPQAGRFYIGKGSNAAFDVVLNHAATGTVVCTLAPSYDNSDPLDSTGNRYYQQSIPYSASPVSITLPKAKFEEDKSSGHRITVQANDGAAGNSLIQEYQLYYDADGPVISANVSDKVIQMPVIKGDIYDEGVGVDYATLSAAYTYNGGTENLLTFHTTPTAADNKWEVDSPTNGEGRYKITLTANDTLGNPATKELEFTYDAANPQITELKVGDTEGVRSGDTVYTNKNSVTVSVKAADTHGIDGVTIDGHPAAEDTGDVWKHNINTSSLSAGRHTVNIAVKDKADKLASATVTLFVDKDEPEFTSVMIGGKEHLTSSSSTVITTYETPVTLKGEVKDTGSGVEKVEFSLNASDPSPAWKLVALEKSGTNYTFNGFTPIAVNNTETVTLRITDRAGNTEEWKRSVKVLSEIPEFAIKVPPVSGISDSGTPIRKGPFKIQLGCYVDGALGTEYVEDIIVKQGDTVIAAKADGYSNFFDGWTSSLMLKVTDKAGAAPTEYTVKAGLASGEYTITLKAKRITSSAGRVIIDELGPQISLTNPLPDAKHLASDSVDNWSKQHLFGKTVINGSFTDDGVGMRPKTDPAYTCRIGKNKSLLLATDRFELLSTARWSLEIASAEKYCEDDTYVLEKYNSENILDSANGKVFKIPLYITAKDKLNNTTEEIFYIMIASDGKMPIIDIQAPSQEKWTAGNKNPQYDGLEVITVGGIVQFSGLVQTANPAAGKIKKVYVSFSTTESFDDKFTAKLKAHGDSAAVLHTLAALTADGKGIPIADGDNLKKWSFIVDTNDFVEGQKAKPDNPSTMISAGMDGSVTLFYKIQAENDEGKTVWTAKRKIIFDKNVPYASGKAVKRLQKGKKPGDADAYPGVSSDPANPHPVPYINNIAVKDGDMLVCELLSSNDISEITLKSGTKGASYINAIGTRTGETGEKAIPDAVIPVEKSGSGTHNHKIFTKITNGYRMELPIQLTHLQDDDQILSVEITITDNKTDGKKTSFMQFNLKYDKANPAVVFGKPEGKIGTGNFSAANANNIITAKAGMSIDDLYVFVETKDESAKAIKITGIGDGYISYANQGDIFSNTGSMYMLVRKYPIVYDAAASGSYQVEGFVYDKGTGVKEVKTAIANQELVIKNFIGELGNFSRFKESLKTFDIADGVQTLTMDVIDKAGNTGTQASDTVYLRNHPLRIAKVHFKTDLDYNGNYENVQKRGLVEIVTGGGAVSNINDKKNYVQKLDIHQQFAFKNGGKSQIEFELTDGRGTSRTYEIYAAGDDGNIIAGAKIKRGTLTANAIDLSSADFTGANPVFPEGKEKKFAIVLRDEAAPMNTGTGDVTGDTERRLTLLVTLGVKTVDTRQPQVVILPFYWNGESDNSIVRTKDSNGIVDAAGHVEIARVSVDSSGNPSQGVSDVSGTVVVRGTAYHPARLTKLELTVPNTASSASEVTVTADYTAAGWNSTSSPKLEVTDERIDVNRHWVAWEYVWDTGTPAVNKEIKAAAKHDSVTSVSTAAGSLVPKNAQERPDEQSLKLAAGDTAVKGQFLRLIKDEHSYLVTINRVNDDGTVEWRLTNVPKEIEDYYLYPVDYSTTGPSYNAPEFKVNIVPYITGIETPLSIGGDTEPDLYARTALGCYPVKDGATITVKGFNLKAADSTGAVCTVVKGADSSTSKNLTAVSGKENEWTLKLPADAKSGTLTAKVNGIEAINNKNDNAKDYNKAKKTANNDKLTDDVELDVWQFNSQAALPDRGYVAEPVMRINPANGMIGFAFANGPDFFSMSKGKNNSYQEWHKNNDEFREIDFVYDSSGTSHGVVVAQDMNSDRNQASNLDYLTSQWGSGGYNYSGEYALRLEKIGQIGNMKGEGGNILDKNRIQHPSLAVAKNADNGDTRLYLAYYDNLNDQIRFKAGTLKSTMTWNERKGQPSDTKYKMTDSSGNIVSSSVDIWARRYWKSGAAAAQFPIKPFGQFVDEAWTKEIQKYNQDNVSIVAGKYMDGTVIKPTGNNTGTYLSLGVVPGATADKDVAVLVWFDETSKKLKYTYNKYPTKEDSSIIPADNPPFPIADPSNPDVAKLKFHTRTVPPRHFGTQTPGTSTPDGYWNEVKDVFGDKINIGEYCKLVVDKDGGIHIAAYSTDTKDLYYAYLSKYDGASFKTSVVDSYGITGSQIRLDVALSANGKPIPYIDYYSPSAGYAKLAYLVDKSSGFDQGAAGAKDGYFTGDWEVTCIPTTSDIVEDNINVGVWKDAAGKIKASVAGSSSSTTTNGKVYGNGTANPVLGYAITKALDGFIETAQKK
ncbi:MAG: hypothetical protein ACTTI6_05465 [Treponema sp.]|uniref:hypothetical protein n=1 Tax=Treponema sp. TaxID=166 RepID=UPI003FA20DAB